MPETLGPNTNADAAVLQERCLLCAGENSDDLLKAFDAARRRRPTHCWAYRGYEFWHDTDFCLILSGIGTGCLEPLLFEILRPGVIRKIVLMGTAGSMPGAEVELGEAHLIDEGWPAGTGIDGEPVQLPLRPRGDFPPDIRRASAVSSDCYYGFSPAVFSLHYPSPIGRLRELFAVHTRLGTKLLDMEVAQFYYFCSSSGDAGLEYAAVKAPANIAGHGEQQILHTPKALVNCLRAALRLLGVTAL